MINLGYSHLAKLGAIPLIIKNYPCLYDYSACLHAMRTMTQQRSNKTPDEIWLVEHPPIYTLGLAGDPKHLLNRGSIELVQSDRGGQITYHGPGQLLVYTLIDLKRLGLGVTTLVDYLEQAVISFCQLHDVDAYAQADARGVYVNGHKIAAIGLKIRHGCSYHGLAINVNMNLQPYLDINPCGYPGLQNIDLDHLNVPITLSQIKNPLLTCLLNQFQAEFKLTFKDMP